LNRHIGIRVLQAKLKAPDILKVVRTDLYPIDFPSFQHPISHTEVKHSMRTSAAGCRITRQIDVTHLYPYKIARMIFLHPLDRQDLLIGGKVEESPARIVSKFFRGIENQLTQIQNIQPIDAAVAVDIGGYFHILTLQCLFLQDVPLDIDQISSTDPITESNVFVRYDAYFGSMVNAKLE